MKRLALFLALAPLLTLAAEPAPKPVDSLDDLRLLAEKATVAAIEFTPPAGKGRETEKALWDRFANKPEEKPFAIVTAREWKAKWNLLVEVLVTKAEQQKLNGAELRACLSALNMGLTEETAPQPLEAVSIGQMYTKDGKVIEDALPKPPPEPLPEPETSAPPDGPITYSEPPDTGMEGTIPVGAYLGRSASGPCWIIVCKWEMAHPDHPDAQLGHIRIWAVDCATHKIIGFTGCD